MTCKPRPTTLHFVIAQSTSGHRDLAWKISNVGALTGDCINRLLDPGPEGQRLARAELNTAWGTWQHRIAVWEQLHPELVLR